MEALSRMHMDLSKSQLELRESHMEFIKKTRNFFNETRTNLNNQASQLRNLETRVRQLASMFNERQHGNLTSTSEVNPRRDGKEQCKSITLRSGKKLENSYATQNEEKVCEKYENFMGN